MQDGRKEAWSIPYVYVAVFFPSLKQNFIAYRPHGFDPTKPSFPSDRPHGFDPTKPSLLSARPHGFDTTKPSLSSARLWHDKAFALVRTALTRQNLHSRPIRPHG